MRPYEPAQLKQRLAEFAAAYTRQGKTCTPLQRTQVIIGMTSAIKYGMMVERSSTITDIRHIVLNYLFDVRSNNSLTDGQVLACLKWLELYDGSDGKWHVNPLAEREIGAVYCIVPDEQMELIK